MLLSMLKAVKNMIYIPISPEIPPEVWKAKIECASTILDEIIKNLEVNPPSDIIQVPITAVVEKFEKTHPNPVVNKALREKMPEVMVTGNEEKEWMITIDENKGLKIIDFPLDGMVELDGKAMPYSEARGQTFNKARIL